MTPYIANTPLEVKEMLSVIGVNSIDDLFVDIKPQHRPKSFHLPTGRSEMEVVDHIRKLAAKNAHDLILFIGGGYYDHYVPAAVTALVSRAEFYTAYTPYQPECSQGTLQALYEYQSAICSLTGMDVANASLYDGGTALYEAMMMAIRITGRKRIVMDGGVSPIYRKMLRSYTTNLDIEFVETPVTHGQADRAAMKQAVTDQTAAVILQNPNFFGAIDDHSDLVQMVHDRGGLAIAGVYPLAMLLYKSPAEMGMDIVVGEGQGLGLPLNFGGPYLGFMSTRKEYIRKMPGRIVAQTVDAKGQRCFVNTLQAREQHIRREKATSNICTNVSLCAVQAAMFMSLIGQEGLKQLALLNLKKAEYARQTLEKIPGVQVKRSSPTFNEFTLQLPQSADTVVAAMMEHGFAAGFSLSRYYPDMKNFMIVAVTERRTKAEIDRYAECLAKVLKD